MSKMRVVQVTHSKGAFSLVERDKVRNASSAIMNGVSSAFLFSPFILIRTHGLTGQQTASQLERKSTADGMTIR